MANFSKQREAIKEFLKGTNTHPTAAEVYGAVKKTIPNISLGTVYRNLENLCETGEILSLDFGDGALHYDGNLKEHIHLHCTVCGKTQDVFMPDTAAFCAALDNGFKPSNVITTVYGVCNKCKLKEGKEK